MATGVGIGVVGLGYWGSNLARSLAGLPGAELRWLCDRDVRVLAREQARYRGVRGTSDVRRVLDDRAVRAVVIATPLATHAQLAREALEAGKDVLVQPPLAFSSEDARELLELATTSGRVLLAGHVLLFHPAMRMLKESIDLGELGRVHYLYGNLQRPGGVRSDVDVLWDLGAPHVAAVLYLLDQEPQLVSARGASGLDSDSTDAAFCQLAFGGGLLASLQLSWLEAEKVHRLTVVGSEQIAVFDELDPMRLLTVYDKGRRSPDPSRRSLRFAPGAIASPSVPAAEPLTLECEAFVAAVERRTVPADRVVLGVTVVAVLEALELSLDNEGANQRFAQTGGENVVPFRTRS
jgi:predicted dehydrogenase